MRKTKAEEREALAKIREILSGLGDDSYVGKAFEGCIEQAEENICSDWMLSWKGRYLDEQAKNCKYAEKVGELTRRLNQKDDAIARLEAMRDDYTSRASLEEAQRQISDLRQTILELKAKLYDMMTWEEGEW